MHIIADICVTPLGQSASVHQEIKQAYKILRDTGLPVHLHAYGTNIEGDFETIVDALRRIHEDLHQNGVQRISTTLRLDSRIDKEQTMEEKIKSAEK